MNADKRGFRYENSRICFDGRNILDHKRLVEIGFNVYPLGSPPLKHF
jgi:UDPglucose 6-dehydrogenase